MSRHPRRTVPSAVNRNSTPNKVSHIAEDTESDKKTGAVSKAKMPPIICNRQKNTYFCKCFLFFPITMQRAKSYRHKPCFFRASML